MTNRNILPVRLEWVETIDGEEATNSRGFPSIIKAAAFRRENRRAKGGTIVIYDL